MKKGPFGLRWCRLQQWWRVLKREKRNLTIGVAIGMVRLALRSKGKPDRRTVVSRYWRCWHCPLFDRDLRRCRPFDESQNGCGCYTPYSIVAGKACWLRQYRPEVTQFGYE